MEVVGKKASSKDAAAKAAVEASLGHKAVVKQQLLVDGHVAAMSDEPVERLAKERAGCDPLPHTAFAFFIVSKVRETH